MSLYVTQHVVKKKTKNESVTTVRYILVALTHSAKRDMIETTRGKLHKEVMLLRL